MLKTEDAKELDLALKEKQKNKGTYDSPCMSICNYAGLFKQCATCSMRKVEKKLWKSAGRDMKEIILRAVAKRIQ